MPGRIVLRGVDTPVVPRQLRLPVSVRPDNAARLLKELPLMNRSFYDRTSYPFLFCPTFPFENQLIIGRSGSTNSERNLIRLAERRGLSFDADSGFFDHMGIGPSVRGQMEPGLLTSLSGIIGDQGRDWNMVYKIGDYFNQEAFLTLGIKYMGISQPGAYSWALDLLLKPE